MSLIGKRWKKFPEPQPLRTDQPNMNKPLAMIQLPTTRNVTRAQSARTRITFPDRIATAVNCAARSRLALDIFRTLNDHFLGNRQLADCGTRCVSRRYPHRTTSLYAHAPDRKMPLDRDFFRG